MSHLLEFLGWVGSCVLSAIVLTTQTDFNPNSVADITMWLVVAGLFMLSATVILTVIATLVGATIDAREYYRLTPDAQWPDKPLVRLCMWRCR